MQSLYFDILCLLHVNSDFLPSSNDSLHDLQSLNDEIIPKLIQLSKLSMKLQVLTIWPYTLPTF